MKFKPLSAVLCSGICFGVCSSGTFNFNDNAEPGVNTVPIIFSSGDGKFTDGSTKKVYEVRTGIKWSQLKEGFERPRQVDIVAPTSSAKFDNTWLNESGKAMSANYIVNTTITVTANYSAESFATASWDVIANFFNGKGNDKNGINYKGTEGLAAYFGHTDSYKNHSCEWLIGQERYLRYAGEYRKVVVIGFNADKVDDDKGWGSITFQFVDTITDAPFNYTESNKYYGSHLENYLNNAVYNNIEETVRENIVEVKKWTYDKSSSKKVMKKEKLFPLSLTEMNVSKPSSHGSVPKETISSSQKPCEGLLNDDATANSVPYAFYEKDKKGNYIFPKEGEGRANADPSKKTDINGNPSAYWLRTYDNVSDSAYNTNHCYTVDADGNVGNTQKVNYTCGVAPAFCFGQSNIVKESFTTCSWDTITSIINTANNRTDGTATSGLDELKQAFSDDNDNTAYPGSFIGLTRKLKMKNKTYDVRVIDEEKDNLKTAKNKVTKAALTFETVQVVSDDNGDAVKEQFGDDNCNNFINDGKLLGVCNGEFGKQNMDSTVKNNLKEVTKWYNWAKKAASTTTGISSYNTYVFPFKFKELGGYIGDGDWNVGIRGQVDVKWKKKQNSGISDKSSVYKYYADTVSSSQTNEKRKKKDIKGNWRNYHLGELFEDRFKGAIVYQWAYSLGVNSTYGTFDPYNRESNTHVGTVECGSLRSKEKLAMAFGFCL